MSYQPPQDPFQTPSAPGSPPPQFPAAGPYPPQPVYLPPVYHQQVVMAVQPPTSGLAVTSLVMGIIGILGGWCLLGIPCVLAVICGHAGLAATNGNARSGRGLAVAGLVMGYICVIPAIIIFFMIGGLGVIGGITSPTPTVTP
jgi:hypothetical protein